MGSKSAFALAKTTHPWERPDGDRVFAGLQLSGVSMPSGKKVSNFADRGGCTGFGRGPQPDPGAP